MTEILKKLLERRGVKDFDAFLNPSLEHLQSPTSLPGIKEASEAMLPFITKREKIVVFGDYDCDGICATAILVRVLKALKANVVAFLPRRLDEGYGMTDKSVKRLLDEHPDVKLVVTVDNGINSIGQIDYLKSKSIDVVVTDHHLPGESLPRCISVNPKVASPPELADICGAGVAYLLAQEIVLSARKTGLYSGPKLGGPLIVLAGLATVTDIMPLLGYNRALVSNALKHFGEWAPQGLKKLLDVAMRKPVNSLNSRHFGFMLGPRINADGRMAEGLDALNLVLSDDADESYLFAQKVDDKNRERKDKEQTMTDEALSKIVPDAPAQVIELDEGHKGVVGIVASRVLEHLRRRVPVCVIAQHHGSARSPEGVNIRDAFDACKEHLTNFGGHAAAGGFSVLPGHIDLFREAFCRYARNFVSNDQISDVSKSAELVLSKDDVTSELADEIQRLEPFGEGNPEPVFLFSNPKIEQVGTFCEGKHLSAMVNSIRAVWWNHGREIEKFAAASTGEKNILFTIEKTFYKETPEVELRIQNYFESSKQPDIMI